MTIRPFPVRAPNEFDDDAFAKMVAELIDILMVGAGTLTIAHTTRLVELAAKARIPAMYGSRSSSKRVDWFRIRPTSPTTIAALPATWRRS